MTNRRQTLLTLGGVWRSAGLSFALAASLMAQAPPTYFARTVAGTASHGDGGPALAARIVFPERLTRDDAGNFYFSGNGQIRRIAADGTISGVTGKNTFVALGDGGPAIDADFSSAAGVVVRDNVLYFVQARTPCQIRRVDLTTGIITAWAGDGRCAAGPDGPLAGTSLNNPIDLAIDSQGRMYVSEETGVRRIDIAGGRISRFAGGGDPGFAGDGGQAVDARLNRPIGLAVDRDNNVFISDFANCRIRRVNTSGVINTIAGAGTCAVAGDGGPAIAAQFLNPVEIAIDSTRMMLYVANNQQTIRRINLTTGIVDRFAGTGGVLGFQSGIPALQADLRNVIGLFAGPAGDLFFLDFNGHRMGRIDGAGILSTFAGAPIFGGDNGPAQSLSAPFLSDVLVLPDGALLIADSTNRRVRRVTPQGVAGTFAGNGTFATTGGNGGPALNASLSPTVLARDTAANIYVTDTLSNTVRRIATNGIVSAVGPPLFSAITGLAIDTTQRFIYFAHGGGHRILRVDLATGANTTFAGLGAGGDAVNPGFSGDNGPANAARLNTPGRLAVDAQGNLYVADSGNNRVRRISASGDRIVTVMGNGQADGEGDGNLATQASLPVPLAVAVDSAGNVFASNATAIFRLDQASGRMHRISGGAVRGTSNMGAPALGLRLNFVNGLAVDSRGVIYASEASSHRIIALTPSTLATPAISGVITPGAFGAGTTLSPGGWLEIYGEKFAAATREWAGGDFTGNVAPTALGGVRVRIQGRDAFVQLISAGQINAVAPDGILPGNVTVEVINANGASDTLAMVAAPRGPSLLAPPSFRQGTKQFVVAVLPDGAFAGPPDLIPGAPFRRAGAGTRAVLYGVGFGGVAPLVPAGNVSAQATALPNVRVRVGDADALVEYAGLAGGFVGLYQFNIVIPPGVTGDVTLTVTVDGVVVAQSLLIGLE